MATNTQKRTQTAKKSKKAVSADMISFTQSLHPDIYQRAEEYQKDFGLPAIQDVIRQALPLFLQKYRTSMNILCHLQQTIAANSPKRIDYPQKL
jgi:hypothetical protein